VPNCQYPYFELDFLLQLFPGFVGELPKGVEYRDGVGSGILIVGSDRHVLDLPAGESGLGGIHLVVLGPDLYFFLDQLLY
jgi:hypothetical protein